MKRIAFCVLFGLASVNLIGCAEKKAEVKKETTVTTPGGETKMTETKTVETTGDNPPPAKAP
jgi:hypothetical protein